MNGSMQETQTRPGTEQTQNDDFITIFAPTLAEIWESFREQGLAEKHYAIVHRTGRHAFTVAGGSRVTPLFEGAPMIAATFARRM